MVKTIYEQTGFKRRCEFELLQDSDLLEKVTEYDFNLKDYSFRVELSERGVIDFGIEFPENEFTQYDLEIYQLLENSEIKNHPAFMETIIGKKLTEKEKILHSKIIILIKASIQDCWEIYKNDNPMCLV